MGLVKEKNWMVKPTMFLFRRMKKKVERKWKGHGSTGR